MANNNRLNINSNPEVAHIFNDYPDNIRDKIDNLRRIIIETVQNCSDINEIEETLKWNEPSYLTKYGSTIRIDWKSKFPEQYAIYFKCTSKLIETFRIVYGDLFNYEGNRAIIFKLNEIIPEEELKHCIKAALTYHKVKHLPLLGL